MSTKQESDSMEKTICDKILEMLEGIEHVTGPQAFIAERRKEAPQVAMAVVAIMSHTRNTYFEPSFSFAFDLEQQEKQGFWKYRIATGGVFHLIYVFGPPTNDDLRRLRWGCSDIAEEQSN